MQGRPLAFGQVAREARMRRLLEKFAIALGGAALLCVLLFAAVHLNEAISGVRADVTANTYYANCAAARAAGVAPIYVGQPGYRPGLDADNDGIACEPYRNWGANN